MKLNLTRDQWNLLYSCVSEMRDRSERALQGEKLEGIEELIDLLLEADRPPFSPPPKRGVK